MPEMLWIVSNVLVALTAWFGQAKLNVTANSEATEKIQPGADIYGEPLPPGALARMGTVQFRHPTGSTKHLYSSPATSVAFSPDGQVITTGLPQSLRFWNANTGQFLFEIESPDFWGGQVYSPDGRFIAAPMGHLTPETGAETYAGVWDVKTRKLHHRFPPENGFGTHIWHIAFSRDGKLLAMAHEKGAIHLWNLDTGQEVAVFHQASKGGPLAGIAFSQDGKTLVSMPYQPDEFWHWDLVKRRPVKVVLRAIRRTQNQSLWLSHDGTLACLYGTDGIVHTLDTSTGEELWAQPAGGRIAFTPDGRLFANAKLAVERAIDVTLRDAKTGNALRSFTMPPILQEEGYLAFFPDGSRMANGGFYPRLFDVANGKELLRKPAHEGFVYGLAFTPDSKTLLSGGADHMLGVWDVVTGQNRHFVNGNRWMVTGVAAVPGGNTFVSGGQDGIIRLHDWRTGREVRRFGFDVGKNERSPQFKKLQVSPDGKTVTSEVFTANGSKEAPFHSWDLAIGKLIKSHPKQGNADYSDLAGDGKHFLGVQFLTPDHGSSTIELRELATGRQLFFMRDIDSWDRRDAGLLTRDGRLLIRASAPTSEQGKGIPTIRLLEVATGKERLRIVADKEGCFEKIALSPDEGVLATAHDDHIIQFWDLSTGKELLRHPGYTDSVSAMAFSPNGKYLATGHAGGEILAWDAPLPERPRPRFAGAPNDRESWWKDLASDQAAKAHRTISMLVDFPQEALALFKDRLRPAASAPVVDTRERIAKLIAQLDDGTSAVREAASNTLEGFGPEAEPALRQALEQKISLEKRRRIKEILEHPAMPRLDPELLRVIRAVEVLEHIATLGADASRLSARDLLRKLAGGDLNARLTQEANAALRRLRREG